MVISFINTKEKYLKIELKPEKENMHSEIYSMILGTEILYQIN